jgi:hypothetical protein
MNLLLEHVNDHHKSLSANSSNPDPHTGQQLSQHDKLASVLAQAELTEQLGYDAYQIGERHGAPFLCSSPTVLLSAVAQRTSRVRLLTGVTVLSIHDPVLVAEEYALLDHLSEGLVAGERHLVRPVPRPDRRTDHAAAPVPAAYPDLARRRD